MNIDENFRGFFPGSKHPLPAIDEEPVAKTKVKPQLDWDSKPITKAHGDHDVEFFTIGALALALNRSPVSVRVWIREGHLPPATYRLPEKNGIQGRRLYTRAQIEAVIAVATQHDLFDQPRVKWSDHEDFAPAVRQAWGDLPPL